MIFIINHAKLLLCCTLAIAFFLFLHIPQVRNIEDVDHFIIKGDIDAQFYQEFKSVFNNDEFFIIAFSADKASLAPSLRILKNITDDLEKIKEIREVKSLANIDDTIGSEDFFTVRKFIEKIPDNIDALELIKKQAINNALYRNNFISADGTTLAVVVSAYNRPDDDYYRHRLMKQTQKILEKYNHQVEHFYLAGKTVTDTVMSNYMEKDVSLLLPLSYLLIALCLYYFYRNLLLVILGVVNISFCLGSVMGFMGIAGITQNSVTSIVLPLIMALSLCDTVHLFSHMTGQVLVEEPNKYAALSKVLKQIIWPCFMTSLTTAIGFLSLLVSNIPPIREFAIIASVGMGLEFLFSFFLLPPLILFMNPKKLYADYHASSFVAKFLNIASHCVLKYKTAILIISLALFVLSCIVSLQIKAETNIFDFFKKNSLIRSDLQFVESELAGVESFDISLKSDEIDAFKIPDNLKLIEKIQNYAQSLQGVDDTLSFTDFIKDMNQSFHNENPEEYRIPNSRKLISQYLLLYDSDDIEDFVNSSYNHARISIRISEHYSPRQQMIFEKLGDFIDRIDHHDVDIRITGRTLQDLNIIRDIFSGQMKSIVLAVGIIWLVLFALFRSFRMGFVSIIPNIFPIVLNFGVMGAFGIPLNTATALISAVAIGISVDDTIHFLLEFKKQKRTQKPIFDVLNNVIHQKGRAIFSSSLILSVGFGVLTLSSFMPTVHFGLLCACIMICAVLADIFLLPAILLCI